MFTITVILRIRIFGRVKTRKNVHKFANRSDFDYALWELLQSDAYRVNDKDSCNVILTVDNGV